MEHDDSQERTEEATEKRLRDSKDKGSVARSKDLNSTILLIGGALCFMFFSNHFAEKAMHLMKMPFQFVHSAGINDDLMVKVLLSGFVDAMMMVLPFLIMVLIGGILGSLVVGGWVFSMKNAAPQLERLNPLKGLAKIFSVKSLVELLKSVLKFVLVLAFAVVVFSMYAKPLISLNFVHIDVAIIKGLWILLISVFIVCLSLVIISGIDVPFQIWQHTKQLKMTKQEVKDEMKETDGSPEVKAKIAQLQRQQARRRMMEKIPEADVVITNPTHYAVALKYDEGSMGAPVVVAKGGDLIAEKIKQVAIAHDVPIVSIPALARSVYHFTELDEEIPGDLYVAVAQVLAYIYQLSQFKRGKVRRPEVPSDVPIPENMRRDPA